MPTVIAAILFNSWSVCVGGFPYSASGSFMAGCTSGPLTTCAVDRTRQDCNIFHHFLVCNSVPTNSQNLETRPLFTYHFASSIPFLHDNPTCWLKSKVNVMDAFQLSSPMSYVGSHRLYIHDWTKLLGQMPKYNAYHWGSFKPGSLYHTHMCLCFACWMPVVQMIGDRGPISK